MSRFLGDNEDRGRLLLGGERVAAAGQGRAVSGGGGVLKITRDRLRPTVSVAPLSPVSPPSPGGGNRGGLGQYSQW